MDRRHFLKSGATGLTALASLPWMGKSLLAQAPQPAQPILLKAVKRTLDINGRAASVFALMQENGTHGVRLDAGRDFDVSLANDLGEPTLIHWHGMTPPWPLDGVPDTPAPLLKAGESRPYAFPPGKGGTHWMHAHTLQEQNLLAAPLIVRTAEDMAADEQEVVILLHDFSFTPAEELLAKLTKGGGHGAMHGGAMPGGGMMSRMMGNMMQGGGGMMGMNVNDIQYDAYLANDRTLADPETVKVERGGKVRLRIINGATATAFTIDTGVLDGSLIAVDWQPVAPISGKGFPILMGQRLDIRLTLPKEGGAFPILALREGAKERTGIVLATPGATIAKLPLAGDHAGPIVGLNLEGSLRAAQSLAKREPSRRYAVTLTGGMGDYEWSVLSRDPLIVRSGERVEIAMRNMSMMTHPMHLHGHHFQVVAINGERFSGAVRDTVGVPHMAEVTIAFDADNPGKWPFHCHHLYHMAAGMMGYIAYDGAA
jgi:FtsP/CotA-like multicopper oxidase with cupredoxin domain